MSVGVLVRPGASATGHIAGLDLWRALLMMAGIFVHGSLWLPHHPLFTLVGDASQAFRMGCFFAISGLLSAKALERRDPARWLRRRCIQLGIPALCALGTLSPLIWYAVRDSNASALGWPLLPFEWHHLWYLFGLILYSMMAVGLDLADRRGQLIRRLDDSAGRNGRVIVLATAATSAALLGAATPVLRAILPPDYLPSFGNAQLIAGYMPMFVMGFVLARAGRLCRHVIAEQGWCMTICLGVAAAYMAAHSIRALTPFIDHVQFVAASLCPPVVFALILRSVAAIRHVPAVLKQLSDASYTIYILHYPVSVLLNVYVADEVEPAVAYVLNVLASGAACFALHVLVVRRSPTLLLLINGKVSRTASRRQSESVAPIGDADQSFHPGQPPYEPVGEVVDCSRCSES